jgi:hypothetical protein
MTLVLRGTGTGVRRGGSLGRRVFHHRLSTSLLLQQRLHNPHLPLGQHPAQRLVVFTLQSLLSSFFSLPYLNFECELTSIMCADRGFTEKEFGCLKTSSMRPYPWGKPQANQHPLLAH